MAVPEGVAVECKQTEESNGTLICGLPDDIALLCLAMVPRRYHHILRCVSRGWRALLCSEEWLSCRQKNNLAETWIYAMCRDKSRGNCYYVLDPDPSSRFWKPLHAVPPRCLKTEGMSFEASGSKLYLLGGCSWQKDATDEVYCYDACANMWGIATSMPTARCYFVSATLDNKLYVTGGLGVDSTTTKSWDIYDSDSDSWISHKDPTILVPDINKFVTSDGKIYTIHKTWNGLHHLGVYDPACGSWQGLDHEVAEMSLCCRGPTIVVDGTLFMLDETIGTRLMMWQRECKEWIVLGRLSHQFTRPPCQLAAIGRSIFLIGQGLSTMVINVDEAMKLGGMLKDKRFSGSVKLPCVALHVEEAENMKLEYMDVEWLKKMKQEAGKVACKEVSRFPCI